MATLKIGSMRSQPSKIIRAHGGGGMYHHSPIRPPGKLPLPTWQQKGVVKREKQREKKVGEKEKELARDKEGERNEKKGEKNRRKERKTESFTRRREGINHTGKLGCGPTCNQPTFTHARIIRKAAFIVYCSCVAVSCSARIAVSAPTIAVRHCTKVNLILT